MNKLLKLKKSWEFLKNFYKPEPFEFLPINLATLSIDYIKVYIFFLKWIEVFSQTEKFFKLEIEVTNNVCQISFWWWYRRSEPRSLSSR